MSAISDILADAPAPAVPASTPAPERADDNVAETPNPAETTHAEDETSPKEPMYTSTTTSTRRNASGSVSSVYSGNKMKHLKKEDGIPLWRKDIQYDFLRLVFANETRCFTKYSDGTANHTFAEIYIDAMAKSSKCSKILKEKLLQDTEGAISMAMVCLLVNVGRMNTTLNFFPEMRAQLRTYHSIPALQAHQDPNAYKQLQDAPRLKSILKGATEDEPQPSTIEDVKEARIPRTNPVNLIFVMSQYAPKISEVHFQPPRDFFDLVMRSTLSSQSRAKAFLWLLWWYLESDFSYEASQNNPFGPGQYMDGEKESGALPLKVPHLESLTEEQAAAENVDTEEEKLYGEVKRKERIAILASEPSPAMTALKRARREKGLVADRAGQQGGPSDDEGSEFGWSRTQFASAGRSSAFNHDTASEYTRSPSPAGSRGFQAVNSKTVGDMRINNLLNNDDAMLEASPPHAGAAATSKKGPGRGNWRRSRQRQENVPLAVRPQDDRGHHVPLLPNTGQLSFVNDGPQHLQPATPRGYSNVAPSNSLRSSHIDEFGQHVPTPSYQAQKRNRAVTQHQSAVIHHRKQQIDYTLDRRIRRVHNRARGRRESEGSILRAWKRMRALPIDYDSEEEQVKIRKAKDRAEKDEDWRSLHKGKENVEANDDPDAWRKPRVLMAGFFRSISDPTDVGEDAKSMARAFRRCSRRLERWQESNLPGQAMIRRRQLRAQGYGLRERRTSTKEPSIDQDGFEMIQSPRNVKSKRSYGRAAMRRRNVPASEGTRDEQRMDIDPDDDGGAGEMDEEDRDGFEVHQSTHSPKSRRHYGLPAMRRPDLPPSRGARDEQRMGADPDDDDGGGGELDEEDRELLGEVDADESEDDEDEEMGDD